MNGQVSKSALAFCIVLSLVISIASTARAGEALKVTVSIVPQKYFVGKIAGDLVDVSVMVLPGASPAIYEPKPKQMVGLTRSRIYFALGVPFERVWLKKFAGINPRMVIVHTDDGIEKMPMERLHFHEGQDRAHHIRDPHIWLSPPLVFIQARNIFDALSRVDPAHGEVYASNYKAFVIELVDLDLKLRNLFMGKGEGGQFMVYHPSWAYFAKAYGLTQVPIEMEGKEPTPKDLEALIRIAKKKGVKVIFVQPQFSTKSARVIAEAIGGRIIVADPLEENWAENLLTVAERIKDALK